MPAQVRALPTDNFDGDRTAVSTRLGWSPTTMRLPKAPAERTCAGLHRVSPVAVSPVKQPHDPLALAVGTPPAGQPSRLTVARVPVNGRAGESRTRADRRLFMLRLAVTLLIDCVQIILFGVLTLVLHVAIGVSPS
jgi:hypothetical protein